MRPNNFQRLGQPKLVTRDAVEKLEQDRPKLNAELHYTIGGSVEVDVHSRLNAEREAAIKNGAMRLNQASEQVKSSFAAAKPDARTEYIRIQRKAASASQSSRKDRIQQPDI